MQEGNKEFFLGVITGICALAAWVWLNREREEEKECKIYYAAGNDSALQYKPAPPEKQAKMPAKKAKRRKTKTETKTETQTENPEQSDKTKT